MDNASFMCRFERVGDLQSQIEKRVERQRPSANPGMQRLAFQQLHGNEILSVLLSDVINGADVRMVQSGSSLSFALEAGKSLGISGQFIGKKLQGHKTV